MFFISYLLVLTSQKWEFLRCESKAPLIAVLKKDDLIRWLFNFDLPYVFISMH